MGVTHDPPKLPPGQQWVAPGKWPPMGERAPRQDDAPWRVQLAGLVGDPFSLSLAELSSLPQDERTIDIHCVTRWSKPAVRFAGVSLAALLNRAGPTAEARFISFTARSDRQHSTSLRLDDALALESLVALSADGEPLAVERGGPVRLVVPRRYFYKSLKWLERIELLAEDRLGFWEQTAGYHNEADPWQEQRYIASGLSKAEARAILSARSVAGRDLLGLQAAGLDLSGLQAAGALLRDADFRGSRLQGACFDGANLTNAHFAGADLRGASFREADLEGADFSGADLRGACLRAASFVAASFFDADLPAGPRALLDPTTDLDAAVLEQLTLPQQAFLRQALRLPAEEASE
ncbi:MAG: nitrate reductase [Planctomycetota bacterium]|nr:MAG: nitrate reductase [Planctomycetota bacterium]